MGTTRIKVFDLSSEEKEVKTAKKHAEKAPDLTKLDKDKKQEYSDETKTTSDALSNVIETEKLESGLPAETSKDLEPKEVEKSKSKKTKSKSNTQSTHHKGAKYQASKNLVEDKNYPLSEALALLPKTSFTKFDPTVEIHVNISEKNTKTTVNMPFLKVEKKAVKYLIFNDKRQAVKDKHVIWADEKTVAEIEKGILKPSKDFDLVIASPTFMPTLAKIAKVLGPKGLMPNPKNGTITDNIEKFLESSPDAVGVAIKSDPTAPIIHTKIGKLSQKSAELEANLKALVLAIGFSKIQNATLTTTMGPAIKLDTTSLK